MRYHLFLNSFEKVVKIVPSSSLWRTLYSTWNPQIPLLGEREAGGGRGARVQKSLGVPKGPHGVPFTLNSNLN